MNDLIKALKENEKPFGLMSEEMQAVGVEKFPITPLNNKELVYYPYGPEDDGELICQAASHPNFIGYLEENGMLWGRRYKNKNTGCVYTGILASEIEAYEVLTPAHVLFRKADQ